MKKELCVKLVIYKDYTEMRGQQNIKSLSIYCLDSILTLPLIIWANLYLYEKKLNEIERNRSKIMRVSLK
jgi:hypothetical protein